MNPDQSNTKPVGPFSTLAGEDLTGMRSRLAVLTHDTGVGEVKLPTSNNALSLVLINDEAADTERVEVDVLIPGRSYRTIVKDAVDPGDSLVLADVGTAADKGKLRKLPAAAGVYVRLGFAEKKTAAGALVEWRYEPTLHHVASADTLTALAFTAGGATGPEVEALRDAVLALLQEQGLSL